MRHRVAGIVQETYLPAGVQDHLEKRSLEMEHRIYLWLRLLWDIILKALSGAISEMNKLIDNLPTSTYDLYETILQKCPSPHFARKVLQFLMVGGPPLTLDEMDVALKLNKQTSSYKDFPSSPPNM